MIDKLKIGGVDRVIRLKYVDIPKIQRLWNATIFFAKKNYAKRLRKAGGEDVPFIRPNEFYFWCIWCYLETKGFWFWKKPYRNMKAMIKDINKDEFEKMVPFVGDRILELAPGEDKKPKNEKKSHSENTKALECYNIFRKKKL